MYKKVVHDGFFKTFVSNFKFSVLIHTVVHIIVAEMLFSCIIRVSFSCIFQTNIPVIFIKIDTVMSFSSSVC